MHCCVSTAKWLRQHITILRYTYINYLVQYSQAAKSQIFLKVSLIPSVKCVILEFAAFMCTSVGTQCLSPSRLKTYCAILWWKMISFFSYFQIMEHRRNEIDRGKPKYSGKNLSQCLFIHHKSHMDWPGIFFLIPGVFPFNPFFVLFNPFLSFMPLMVHTTVFIHHNTNIHAPGGIRTHDPSKRAAAGLRLRPHGHWDRRRDRTRASAMRGQRLTAWAMARS